MTEAPQITIASPTYGRDEVLADTIDSLLRLEFRAAEIIVLDQTVTHCEATEARLREWEGAGHIRRFLLPAPSIPVAMNRGLLEARQDIVLFLDDDLVPFPGLVKAHFEAHREGWHLVAGRVLQPWDGKILSATWAERQYASTESLEVSGFMGGNFSVRRNLAINLGGFDENFVRVAYNFEREFADRWRAAGERISYCPQAGIHHLKASSGGTRTFGEHLTTWFPAHSVGAYYYLLRSRMNQNRVREFLARPVRAVMTRHHLRRPWWIPVTLIAELTGMLWALVLNAQGPRYCCGQSRVRS